MSVSPPAIGSLRLTDSVTPTLASGRYRLTSALAVERRAPGGALSPLPAPPSHTMHFDVIGPRFAVDRADIGDRYPGPDAIGAFGDRLPHVALQRRTLPWERAATDGTPWIAMLVFASDEAQLATGTLGAMLPPAVVTTLKTLDPFTDDPRVVVVTARDLATFRAALPSRSDVKLLAHVRQVNLADTALAGQDDDGTFAIVTANRLPLSNAASGTAYLACLVSLEGRNDVWSVPNGQPPPALIVLHSWTFTSTGAGGTFEHLAAELDVAPFGAGAAGSAALLATDGTIAVQRVLRDGTNDAARYRGPLLGLATGQPLGAGNDMSVACAFELGRLLGASDGRFLRDLVAWHRASDTSARSAMVRADLIETLASAPRAVAARRARGGRGADAQVALTASATSAATTATVKSVLSALFAEVTSTPANLWRAHPAGMKIHAATARTRRSAAPKTTSAKRSQSPRRARSTKRTARRTAPPRKRRR